MSMMIKNIEPNVISNYMNNVRSRLQDKIELISLKSFPDVDDFNNISVYKLAELIATDSEVRMNFVEMIDQVPLYYKEKDNNGNYIHGHYLQSIEEMLVMIDDIITKSPSYNETSLVGFPINTILNWTMGTPSGSKAFSSYNVNRIFKNILNDWNSFLRTPKSLGTKENTVFNTMDGWCSPAALKKLKMSEFLDEEKLSNYENGFVDAETFPYQSWNDFFVRLFKDEFQRPISMEPKIIVSPCESNVFSIQDNCKLKDWFWVKSQPYSLQDMIGYPRELGSPEIHYREHIKPYEGGTVWQAFLAATKYHRWNSPVNGRIKKIYTIDGTYYDAAISQGMDPSSPDKSQGYIAHTATRTVFVIDTTGTDNDVGEMLFIAIGMAEVSTCKPNENLHNLLEQLGEVEIKRGDELGEFQYGGSTSCMIFKPNTLTKENFLFASGDDVLVGETIANIQK